MTRSMHEVQKKVIATVEKAKSIKPNRKKYKQEALDLLKLGGAPLAMKSAPLLKHPRGFGWQTKTCDADYVNSENRWENGVGSRGDGIPGLDIDIYIKELSDKIVSYVKDLVGRDDITIRAVEGTKPKCLIPMFIEGMDSKIWSKVYGVDRNAIEVISGPGAQWKFSGPHPCGDDYECIPPLGEEEIPTLTVEQVQGILDYWDEIALEYGLEEVVRNQSKKEVKGSPKPVDSGTLRGMFNSIIEMTEIIGWMEEAGWSYHSKSFCNGAHSHILTRPGKKVKDGGSAHLFYGRDNGNPILYVFTSNDEVFEPGYYDAYHIIQTLKYPDKDGWKVMNKAITENYGLVDPLEILKKEDKTGVRGLLKKEETEEAVLSLVGFGFKVEEIETVLKNYGLDEPEGLLDDLRQQEKGWTRIPYDQLSQMKCARNINQVLVKELPPEGYCIAAGAIGYINSEKSDEDDEAITQFCPMKEEHIQEEAERFVRLQEKKTKRNGEIYTKDKPITLGTCKKILLLRNNPAPKLYGIMTHPTITKDGHVQGLKTGYDRGLYFSHMGGYYISNLLSEDCYQRIIDICCQDILFEDMDSGRARFIGMMLQLLIRTVYMGQGSYGYNISANQAGTGKSTVLEIAMMGALGIIQASMRHTKTKEAYEKQMIAKMVKKNEVVRQDNIEKGTELDSALLAECLSSGRYEGQPLYSKNVIDLKPSSTFLFAGNGLTVSSELARRIITIQLFSDMNKPANRNCKIKDLRGYIQAHHHEIVSLLMKIVLESYDYTEDYGNATFPGNASDFKYFDWRIRNPIFKITGHDILTGLDDSASLSQETSTEEAFVELLKEAFGYLQFKSSEVISKAVDRECYRDESDLQETAILINGRAMLSTKSMTNALRQTVGKVSASGLMLEEISPKGKHTVKFQVIEAGE